MSDLVTCGYCDYLMVEDETHACGGFAGIQVGSWPVLEDLRRRIDRMERQVTAIHSMVLGMVMSNGV